MPLLDAYRLWLARQPDPFGPAGDPESLAPEGLPSLDGLSAHLAGRRGPRVVLSLFSGHDAAVAIVVDGDVRLNLELERFTRVKHDYGYREDFLRHCLERAGLGLDDVGVVCLNQGLADAAKSRPGTVNNPCPVPMTGGRQCVPFLARLQDHPIPALAVNHHVAHAASAFYTSPFARAAILTLDGGGDQYAGTIGLGVGVGSRMGMLLNDLPYSNLAHWWQKTCRHNWRIPPMHEHDSGFSAGKIMALAAYGRPDPALIHHLTARMGYNWQARAHIAGVERVIDPSLGFNNGEDLSDTRSRRSQDAARALQEVTNTEVSRLFHYLHDLIGFDDLCYAGGLALNCVATEHALGPSPFRDVHVPPCPNDAGIALGMALYAWNQLFPEEGRRAGYFSPYTGPVHAPEALSAAVAQALGHGAGIAAAPVSGGDEAVARAAAAVLARGDILLCWRQRGECGPRALGHRSFLCRPDLADIRERMNAIKKREWYRPFAPIIPIEFAADVLETVPDHAWYMTVNAHIRPEWRQRLAGVCHVDGSTRPQVVSPETEPFVHALAKAVHQACGVPAILNTSFNLQEPIVETPAQAVATWLRVDVPCLLLHDVLLTKAAP